MAEWKENFGSFDCASTKFIDIAQVYKCYFFFTFHESRISSSIFLVMLSSMIHPNSCVIDEIFGEILIYSENPTWILDK